MRNETERANLSKRMKQARERLKMKQVEVAKMAGIHATTYSNIETGNGETFNKDVYECFDKLGINLHWLITGDGAMFRDIVKDATTKEPAEPLIKEIEVEKKCCDCRYKRIVGDMMKVFVDKVMGE